MESAAVKLDVILEGSLRHIRWEVLAFVLLAQWVGWPAFQAEDQMNMALHTVESLRIVESVVLATSVVP